MKKVFIFSRKEERRQSLDLDIIGEPNGWDFFLRPFIFFYFAHLQWEMRRSKLNQKCKLWIHLFSIKTWTLQNNFKQFFLAARVLLLMKFLAKLDHIWGTKNPKTSQKRLFHELLNWYTKLWTFFNLTTIKAILMKLTTIVYPHEIFNLKI